MGIFDVPVSRRRCLLQKGAVRASRVFRFGGRKRSPQKTYLELGVMKRINTKPAWKQRRLPRKGDARAKALDSDGRA